MSEQERPTDDAAADVKPATSDRGMTPVGIVFLVVGVGLMVGPGSAGVPFLVIGLIFLATGTSRRRR